MRRVVFGLCVTLAAPLAGAQPIEVSVPAADACLERGRLGDLLEGHTRGSRVDPSLRVAVERAPAGTVSFTIRRGGAVLSMRRFDAPPADCGALHAMLAIAIALALDAESAPAEDPVAPQARSTTTATRSTDRAERGRPRNEVAVQLSGLFGVARELSLGGSIAVHVGLVDALDLRLGALGSLPTRARLGGGSVEIALAAARVDLCPAFPIGRLRGRTCAGALFGRAFGVGIDFETPFSATALWIALVGRVALVAPLTRRLGIEAGVDVLVPLVRPVFAVVNEDGTEAASIAVPAWGAVISVGPSVAFP